MTPFPSLVSTEKPGERLAQIAQLFLLDVAADSSDQIVISDVVRKHEPGRRNKNRRHD